MNFSIKALIDVAQPTDKEGLLKLLSIFEETLSHHISNPVIQMEVTGNDVTLRGNNLEFEAHWLDTDKIDRFYAGFSNRQSRINASIFCSLPEQVKVEVSHNDKHLAGNVLNEVKHAIENAYS